MELIIAGIAGLGLGSLLGWSFARLNEPRPRLRLPVNVGGFDRDREAMARDREKLDQDMAEAIKQLQQALDSKNGANHSRSKLTLESFEQIMRSLREPTAEGKVQT